MMQSPLRLGSQFQDAMPHAARRASGTHYTTEANILKIVRPLFCDRLRIEFENAKSNADSLRAFHAKLASLTFFDPACGCGNFLVLAYRELRRLERDVLTVLHSTALHSSRELQIDSEIAARVSIGQFYGIELDAAAARIAADAMRQIEQQLDAEATQCFGEKWNRPPKSPAATIVHNNALRIDWNDILPCARCSYILGNPPFVGGKFQSREQREDAKRILAPLKNHGVLDYVACWYVAAAEYIQETATRVAFVSTNSISQGEQASVLWSHLFRRGIQIDFAYRTFIWESEANGEANVHCVIIGFSTKRTDVDSKTIFVETQDGLIAHRARQINRYLVDAPDVEIVHRSRPLGDVPLMHFGNQPIDGGHFLFTSDERREFLRECPAARPYLRHYLGAEEFLNGGGERWCLWLRGVDAATLRALPPIQERVERVRAFRLASKRQATRNLADNAAKFAFISHPERRYLLIPAVSSERRRYIPIGFVSPRTIASNACLIVPDATLFHFGVLTSATHMDWTRRVCGRLKSDLRYSANIVYNNFAWPANATEQQRLEIEVKSQKVLDARAAFGKKTLAELYAPQTMPPQLVEAHQELDRAVERGY